GVSAWIGSAGDHRDAWCEACQRAVATALDDDAPVCDRCGERLTLGEPRFEELYGRVQDAVAVLEAWCGDSTRLAPLVPERPRFLSDLDPPGANSADDPELARGLRAL